MNTPALTDGVGYDAINDTLERWHNHELTASEAFHEIHAITCPQSYATVDIYEDEPTFLVAFGREIGKWARALKHWIEHGSTQADDEIDAIRADYDNAITMSDSEMAYRYCRDVPKLLARIEELA